MKSKTRILQICLALACIIFLFICLHPFNRHMGQLPYLISESFNQSLSRFSQIRPSRKVLLITGACKTGKSRALNKFADEMRSNGHLVINIDAAKAKNIVEFFNLIKHEVAANLVLVKQFISSTDLKQLSEIEIPGVDYKSILNSIIQSNISSETIPSSAYLSSISSSQQDSFWHEYRTVHVPIPSFPDSALIRPYLSLCAILENVYDAQNQTFSEWAVHRFFDALEKYKNSLQPIIFIHNYEIIKAFKSKSDPLLGVKLTEAAKARLSRRNLYRDYVPIFVEIKDSLLRIKLDTNTFSIIQTDRPKNAYSAFVWHNRIFRHREYKRIVNHFGYHIGTFSRIFEDLKSNADLDTVIQNYQNSITETVKSIYAYDSAFPNNGTDIMKRLCLSQGRMRITNMTDLRYLKPLFQNGFLFLKKGFKVRTVNKGVTNAICVL